MRHRLNIRRAVVAVSALGVHAFLLLLALRAHTPPRQPPTQPQFVSLWPTIPSPPADERETEAPSLATSGKAVVSGSITQVAPPLQKEPVPATAEPEDAPGPPVDWTQEGSLVARSHGEKLQSGKSDSFSQPPAKMREPCVPKESSFKWNPEEKRVGISGGLPFVRLGNCVVGLGFFACPLGAQPEPNSHLFDDLVGSNRQESSVPDPDYCD